MEKRKKTILKLIISIIIILAIILIAYLIIKHLGLDKISQEQIQDYVSNTGLLAPIVFIAITFLQVTFIPIPSTITIVAGNYLFGFWLSFLYSYIGLILGSMFAFFLGRVIGRRFVDWVVGDHETVTNYIKKMKGKENIVLFFMFLFPFFPDDALCAVAGVLSITPLSFFVMQLFTRIISILGNLLFLSGEIIPFYGWGIPVIIILVIIGIALFIFSMKYSEQIQDTLYKFINKITKKDKNEIN